MEKKINTNRKAFHNYQILEKLEAGLVLLGTEIKALRHSGANLGESFVRITDDYEAFVCQMEIPLYKFGNQMNHEPMRKRKLLLNRKEIYRLKSSMDLKGYSCIPTRLYLKNSLAKLEIGLGKPKKLYDKRETIKKRETDRQISRAMKQNRA